MNLDGSNQSEDGANDYSSEASESSGGDLRLNAYKTLNVARDINPDERRALLTEMRLVTIPGIKPKSLTELIQEDPEYFVAGLQDYVRTRPSLRDYIPPPISIALDFAKPVLEGSFLNSQRDQMELVEDYSRKIQAKFPQARAIILPAAMYAQVDMIARRLLVGPLFRDFHAGSLDQIPGPHVASVGREFPGSALDVVSWNSEYGEPRVGAVPAVVFTK